MKWAAEICILSALSSQGQIQAKMTFFFFFLLAWIFNSYAFYINREWGGGKELKKITLLSFHASYWEQKRISLWQQSMTKTRCGSAHVCPSVSPSFLCYRADDWGQTKCTCGRRWIEPPFFQFVPLHQSYILFISEDRSKTKERQCKIKEGVACSNFHASVGGGAHMWWRETTPPKQRHD